MNTEKQIRKFLDENNPTREEFETYWYNKRPKQFAEGGMMRRSDANGFYE